MNVDFQRAVDRFVGVPLCRMLSLLPRARDRAEGAPPPKKILVILLSEMGSLVLAQPMFSRLRERHPEASFHALVFQNNVIAGVLIIRMIRTALEHGAVHQAGVAHIAA